MYLLLEEEIHNLNFSHYEYEKKYLFTKSQWQYIQSVFDHQFLEAPEFSANRVHSLYFDTISLESAMQVDSGEERKEKFRIRYYTTQNKLSPTAFEEIKIKRNQKRSKKRKEMVITQEAINQLRQNDYPLEDIFKRLLPIVDLSYSRKRFISKDGQIKANIDYDLSIDWTSTLFPPNKAQFFNNDLIIIELKSNNLRVIEEFTKRNPEFHESSFSKYYYWAQRIR